MDADAREGEQPVSVRRIRLAGHETELAQCGESGPAVLLAHAIGLGWRMWQPVMPALAQGRRVYAYDVRGHGHAAGASGSYPMEALAADLVAVLDELGVDRAHVVGLSYGGAIAQTAAVARPERFASLTLLSSTDHPFEMFEQLIQAGEAAGMEGVLDLMLTAWFTPAALALDGPGVRYARDRLRANKVSDWVAAWRAFQTLDVQGRLADFQPSTFVLAGTADPITTTEIQSAIAARIRSAVYRELPGAGHLLPLESPHAVVEAVDAFLAECEQVSGC